VRLDAVRSAAGVGGYFPEADAAPQNCPSALQLCNWPATTHAAELARQREDVLALSGVVQSGAA